MFKEFLPALRLMAVLTVLTGLLYPAVMTGVAHFAYPAQANGSLVQQNGTIVGSSLIGQSFTKPQYFHPRPSAAGSGYDATASGGSNLGPTSAKLLYGTIKLDATGHEVVDFDGIADRIIHYCVENDLPYDSSAPLNRFKDTQGQLDDVQLIKAFNDPSRPLRFTPKVTIPADAVTGSASGLDPQISPANAELQVERIAKARNTTPEHVRSLIAQVTEQPTLGFIGEPRVNVLLLNLELDRTLGVSR